MARLTAVVVVLLGMLLALVSTGAGDDEGRSYTIEFDNAFGLVQGGDVRVAGVNAGTVSEIRLDKRSKKALVEVRLTEPGVGRSAATPTARRARSRRSASSSWTAAPAPRSRSCRRAAACACSRPPRPCRRT